MHPASRTVGSTSTTTLGEPDVRVLIQSSEDIVRARHLGRLLASQAGFSGSHLTIIATVISEVARNIVEYAHDGELILELIGETRQRGIQITATDHGPGIADVTTVMHDGVSPAAGVGLGLSGSRRLMDQFNITSEVGKGTTVTMTKWVA